MFRSFANFGQVAVAIAISLLFAVPTAKAGSEAANIKNCPAGNWCTYHRDVNGTRYSPLKEINKGNVGKLKVAWIFNPGVVKRGVESTPLAIDGSVYAFTNPSTVWKLNGATGERIWAHVPDMDQAVVARSFFGHTRGGAIGDGRVYMGLADGRVIALS
jgi:glucose dehydrogenase